MILSHFQEVAAGMAISRARKARRVHFLIAHLAQQVLPEYLCLIHTGIFTAHRARLRM